MNLDERMKFFEKVGTTQRLIPLLPVVCRLDGRSFHNFTKGLKRPYDEGFSNLMIETMDYLAKETNACFSYCQSDELTLAWYSSKMKNQIFFDGRVNKMTSILAAMCSVYFNRKLPKHLPVKYEEKYPLFDCRVWNLPTLEEGANAFLWRERDATIAKKLCMAKMVAKCKKCCLLQE